MDFTVEPPQPPAPPKIGALQMSAEGAFSIQFEGNADSLYTIDASDDLKDWIELGVPSQPEPGHFLFVDDDRKDFPTRFYRIRSGGN